MGLKISDLLHKVSDEIKSLDSVFDCQIYGSSMLTEDVIDNANIKVQGDKAQCFLLYDVGSFNENQQKTRMCMQNGEMLVDLLLRVVVFAKIDKTIQTQKFSSSGCDISQQIVGKLNENRFGYIMEIKDNPKFINFLQIGDANIKNSTYQIFMVNFSLEVEISTN